MLSNQPIEFCLLIPCYNNLDGLVRSLRSVRYRSNRFLVLVVDDGSKVPVDQQVLERETSNEMNLLVLRLPKNQGITKALNTGLEWIIDHQAAPFIARLDCGDTCHPERFNIQVGRMSEDPSLLLTGSWCVFLDPLTGEHYNYTTPVRHEAIMKEMHFRNVFIHPTVMYSLAALSQAGIYPAGAALVEDYNLFWKMGLAGRVAVIDRFLVICEINKSGLSFVNKGKQLIGRWKVIKSFGSAPLLKLAGFSRLLALFIMPKELILWMKKRKG